MRLLLDTLLGLISIAGGIVLGFFPAKRYEMTSWQERISSAAGFVFAIVFILLVVFNQDVESWIVLISLLAGFGIGKIPALNKSAREKWRAFRPHPVK